MAFVKKTWKDRIAEFPTRRRLTKEDNTSELVTVAREEGTLSQEGDAFSAENMNDLENRIDAEFTEVNGKLEIIVAEDITYSNVSIPSSRTYVSYDAPSKTGFKLIGVFLTGWTGGSSMSASGTLNVCYEKSPNLINIKSISGATFNNVTVTCLYIKEF